MTEQTVAEMTDDARRAVAAARRAAGEPWQDDSDKDIYCLAREAEAIRDRVKARRQQPRLTSWQRLLALLGRKTT